MKSGRWICVLMVGVILAGCGGGGGKTPQATFENFKTLLADKDFAPIWDVLSKETQLRLDENAKKLAEEARTVQGPGRDDLEAKAAMMGTTVAKLKELDGKSLLVCSYTMGAEKGKASWEKLSRGQVARIEGEGDRRKVFVKIDNEVDEKNPLPLVLEDGRWKVDLSGAFD